MREKESSFGRFPNPLHGGLLLSWGIFFGSELKKGEKRIDYKLERYLLFLLLIN